MHFVAEVKRTEKIDNSAMARSSSAANEKQIENEGWNRRNGRNT